MGKYDRPEKFTIVLRGLKKLGLDYDNASKHDVFTCPDTGHKTTLPRHKTKELNKFIVGSVVDFLLANGYTEKDIKKAFKWN